MSESLPSVAIMGRWPAKHWTDLIHSVAFRLAWRNIAYDRIRLATAVIGVGFAVLLMTVQLGLLIGFATTASTLVDRADADYWIVPRGAKDVDQAGSLTERQKYVALSAPGVQSVKSLIVRFAEWRRPDGATQSVIIVGVDPSHLALQPWDLVAGSVNSLRDPNGVIIDQFYAKALGVTRVGQTIEIMKHRARVVGLTKGIRTFTQSPYVFTSLDNARRFTGLSSGQTTYLLITARPRVDLQRIRRGLLSTLPSADVRSAQEFSWQTRFYWLVSTGAGAALLMGAILGLVVGVVIVSQTLYSATLERLGEYATIRALGGDNRFVQTIVLRQGLLSGTFGYGIGIAIALCIAGLARGSSAVIVINGSLLLMVAIVTFAMAVGASRVSIRKVLHADTSSVFR